MAPSANKKFRVLIVDDSAFMRKVLEQIFNSDEQFQVAGQAKDGREAVALASSLKPDLITMDINMPHLDGLQATAEIMTTNPRPIVIVSSDSKDGAASTLKALELGAIEFIGKPSSGVDLDMNSVKEDLLRKARMAAKVRVVRTASRVASSVQNLKSDASAGAPPSFSEGGSSPRSAGCGTTTAPTGPAGSTSTRTTSRLSGPVGPPPPRCWPPTPWPASARARPSSVPPESRPTFAHPPTPPPAAARPRRRTRSPATASTAARCPAPGC